jgi:type II secretory pathway predicted ATPase ExeA
MYLDYFNLKTKPFALSTDPRFLWAGANQRQALATLSYGLKENRGIVVLSGEFGTGKTTLVSAFVQSLDDTVLVAQLPEPGTDPAHFRLAVAAGFGLRIANPNLEALMEALTRLADDQREYRPPFVLTIDEAQGLTAAMQHDLLRLTNREYQDHRLLHILLVGQNEIYQRVARATRPALQNQFSATCRLYPLSESDIADYINLRLRIAGARRALFSDDAVRLIHAFSRGVPRAINLVCDSALSQAAMKGADKVDAETVDLCRDRFQFAIRDHWLAQEVSARDLATLPTEPQIVHPVSIWRRLGHAAAVLLLFAIVGFLFYGTFKNTALVQNTVNAWVSSAAEFFSPLRPSAYPALPEQPAPGEASQNEATFPVIGQRPLLEQDLPSKAQQSPTETVAAPQAVASPTDDAKEI